MPTADSYLRLLEQQRSAAPSNNNDIVSRLDPQAQSSITGGSYQTSGGQRATYTPPTVFQQHKDQSVYGAVKAAQDQGLGATAMGHAAAGTQASASGITATQPMQSLQSLIQSGAQIVGGYVIDDRGVAVGRADSVPGGGASGGGYSAPVPEVAGGNTGGGNTGGGGGGGGTSTPPPNVGPGAAVDGAEEGTFGGYTEAEIAAALSGIEAEFGMTREQLLQDKSMIGAQYRLLMARMNRARIQAQQAATSDAVSRGIYRSGILGENIADVEQQFTEQTSGARQQQTIQEQGIERQLAFLDQGQAAAGAQAQNRILGQAAATMQQAGVGPAEAGFGGAPGVATAPGAGYIQRAPGHIDPGFGNVPGAGQVTNPYEGFPVVGGYYIDPNTGLAVARAA